MLEAVLRRDRGIVLASLAAVTALAWSYLFLLVQGMRVSAAAMVDMAPSWTVGEFALVIVMWTAMMTGMMTPSAAPIILIYARVGRQAALQGKPLAATGFFAGGYLLAWTIFSLAAAAGQWVLHRGLLLTPTMASASAAFSGGVLIAAGLYQWTSAKDACLRQCRAPLSFIQQHGGFRRTWHGSLVIGFRHGLYCIGCCWLLMALLFAVGVMNIAWIAVLTIFVLAEKIVPAGRWLPRITGTLLAAWGLWLLAGATA